jgi:hypothetical protein
MTTAATILNRASRQMLSGTIEERNKLAASINDSATSVVLSYDLGGHRNGSVVELESELLYVWEANQATKTLTVERGYAGTTAASHSSGALTTLNPRFPRQQMLDALNAELDDYSSTANGLFKVVATSLSYNGSDRQINLTSATSVIELIDVRLRYLADDYPVIRGVRLQRDLPTSDFASGFALVFDDAVQAGTLRVRYKTSFTRATSESSDVSSFCGLPSTCDDLLELGIIIRMTAGREVKRSFIESQGDTRRADEVPPGASRDSTANLLRLRRERIVAEAGRLKAQYPIQFRK